MLAVLFPAYLATKRLSMSEKADPVLDEQ